MGVGCLLVRGCGRSWLVGAFLGFWGFWGGGFGCSLFGVVDGVGGLVVFGAVGAVVPAVAVGVGVVARKTKKTGAECSPVPVLTCRFIVLLISLIKENKL